MFFGKSMERLESTAPFHPLSRSRSRQRSGVTAVPLPQRQQPPCQCASASCCAMYLGLQRSSKISSCGGGVHVSFFKVSPSIPCRIELGEFRCSKALLSAPFGATYRCATNLAAQDYVADVLDKRAPHRAGSMARM